MYGSFVKCVPPNHPILNHVSIETNVLGIPRCLIESIYIYIYCWTETYLEWMLTWKSRATPAKLENCILSFSPAICVYIYIYIHSIYIYLYIYNYVYHVSHFSTVHFLEHFGWQKSSPSIDPLSWTRAVGWLGSCRLSSKFIHQGPNVEFSIKRWWFHVLSPTKNCDFMGLNQLDMVI